MRCRFALEHLHTHNTVDHPYVLCVVFSQLDRDSCPHFFFSFLPVGFSSTFANSPPVEELVCRYVCFCVIRCPLFQPLFRPLLFPFPAFLCVRHRSNTHTHRYTYFYYTLSLSASGCRLCAVAAACSLLSFLYTSDCLQTLDSPSWLESVTSTTTTTTTSSKQSSYCLFFLRCFLSVFLPRRNTYEHTERAVRQKDTPSPPLTHAHTRTHLHWYIRRTRAKRRTR